jgi:hypothetical protein
MPVDAIRFATGHAGSIPAVSIKIDPGAQPAAEARLVLPASLAAASAARICPLLRVPMTGSIACISEIALLPRSRTFHVAGQLPLEGE